MKNPKILKVPYNFVPLNEKVVSPYWIDHISQDVPFDDAQSGTIEVTLTAKSPIFVKQGMGKEEAKKYYNEDGVQTKPFEFEQDAEGNYIIPGSSLRGMVRSVLEVLSFGRMVGRVSERRYALRDLSTGVGDQYQKAFTQNTVLAGWLTKEGNHYYIEPCGEPQRISHADIDSAYHTKFKDTFDAHDSYQPKSKEKDTKSAKYKYELLQKWRGTNEVRGAFVKSGSSDKWSGDLYVRSEMSESLMPDATHYQTLVLTGQPGTRNYSNRTGKYLEFLFPPAKAHEKFRVKDDVVENFKFAYFDSDSNKQSTDYKWRTKALNNGERIPIFYQEKDDKIIHFGLSYLYKLPYPQTIEQNIKSYQGKSASADDLADAIFGRVQRDGNNLRGRVQFTHAFAKNVTIGKEVTEILGEPRASFYPTYIYQEPIFKGKERQRKKKQEHYYLTYMDVNKSNIDEDDVAEISGWKRYPVINDSTTRKTAKNEDNKKVQVKFIPLKAGCTFTTCIHYHNLRKIELGALLSALTFHKSHSSCRHQIGMAKPLGFGKVEVSKFKITNNDVQFEKLTGNLLDAMCDFEQYMEAELTEYGGWTNSSQLKEFIALQTPADRKEVDVLDGKYPYNSLLEFRKVKQKCEALPRHSTMRDAVEPIQSLCTGDTKAIRETIAQDCAEFRKRTMPTEEASRQDVRHKIKQSLTKELSKVRRLYQEFVKNYEEKKKEADRKAGEELAKKNQREQERKKAEAILMQSDPVDYTNIFLGRSRQYWSKLEEIVKKHIETVRPALEEGDNSFPAQHRAKLRETIIEIRNASLKDWKKGLTKKRAQVEIWLGIEDATKIFDRL